MALIEMVLKGSVGVDSHQLSPVSCQFISMSLMQQSEREKLRRELRLGAVALVGLVVVVFFFSTTSRLRLLLLLW